MASDDQMLTEFPAAEVVAVSDMIDEPDEVFVLRLSAPVADPTATDIAELGTPSEATIVIEGPLAVALPEDDGDSRCGDGEGSRARQLHTAPPEPTGCGPASAHGECERGPDRQRDQHDPGAGNQRDLYRRERNRNARPSRRWTQTRPAR